MASNDYYETTSCSSEYVKLIQSLEFAFLMKHYKQEYLPKWKSTNRFQNLQIIVSSLLLVCDIVM